MTRRAIVSTIPERADQLAMMVKTLEPQVDEILIQLNTKFGVMPGSAGRLMPGYLGREPLPDYTFLVDDDILYPKDYCSGLEIGAQVYGGVSTVHGRVVTGDVERVTSFYQNRHMAHHRCLHNVPFDIPVEIPGTGVMCLSREAVELVLRNMPEIKYPDTSDLYLAIALFEARLRAWCLAHVKGWIQYNPLMTERETLTIWDNIARTVEGHAHATELFNFYLKLRKQRMAFSAYGSTQVPTEQEIVPLERESDPPQRTTRDAS